MGVVLVTMSLVPPVVPRTTAGDRATAGTRGRRPLPVTDLAPTDAGPGVVYAVSAIDHSGRIADRSTIRAAGWAPGTRLDVQVRDAVILARPAPDGAMARSAERRIGP